MATITDVLLHLRPNKGWVLYGEDLDSIVYDEGVIPITKKEFNDTLKIVEGIKQTQIEAKAAAREAILDRLGLTSEEAALLLG